MVARGYKDGYYKSDAAYSGELVVELIQLPVPTIYPNGGTFNNSVTVYLGTTVLGGVIHFTTDGSEPDASSPAYADPFLLEGTFTVRAKTYLEGYIPSLSQSATFTILFPLFADGFESGTTSAWSNGRRATRLLDSSVATHQLLLRRATAEALVGGPGRLMDGTHRSVSLVTLSGEATDHLQLHRWGGKDGDSWFLRWSSQTAGQVPEVALLTPDSWPITILLERSGHATYDRRVSVSDRTERIVPIGRTVQKVLRIEIPGL